ncbi:MAG: septation protein A [Hyphomicrobium sp.]|uniref:septation protein A n=1 Tax=Hyphomicrobium sp. TaxID=82 RepID=UPI00132B627F|nr:septation protein A [Hyphomicrobium sp.]KAB2944081.1 MAG: septation protein A [Hyphomicrobium sp.]MBZ0209374.1 septation protein A [Hyphomicrobium sp.]MCZ7593904.1 septation protein A [Hyphomicrobium sp.]
MADEATTKPEEASAGTRSQLLKLAVEVGPLVVFFIVNARAGIFWGTGIFMLVTIASLIASRLMFGRIPVMPLVSGVCVVVFGGLTLWLQDDHFIKIKPTIVNALFATALFGGLLAGHSLLKVVFGEVFRLTDDGWRKLTLRWACFFTFLALLNEVIWRTVSTDAWVSFKVFAIMPLTMVFALSQIGLLKAHEISAD